MRSLNLKTEGTPAEVILEQFDLDPKLACITVIDDDGQPSTVTLTEEEVMEISEWAEDFLETVRRDAATAQGVDLHLSHVIEKNLPGDPD